MHLAQIRLDPGLQAGGLEQRQRRPPGPPKGAHIHRREPGTGQSTGDRAALLGAKLGERRIALRVDVRFAAQTAVVFTAKRVGAAG